MAELYGKATGVPRRSGGTMHLGGHLARVPGRQRHRGGRAGRGDGRGARGAGAAERPGGGGHLRRRRREHGPDVGERQPRGRLEAAAHRGVREQPVRGRDPVRCADRRWLDRGPRDRASGCRPAVVDGQDLAAMLRAVGQARAAGDRGRGPDLHRGAHVPLRGPQHGPGHHLSHRRTRCVPGARRATRSSGCGWRSSRRRARCAAGSDALAADVRQEVDAAVAFAEASPRARPAGRDARRDRPGPGQARTSPSNLVRGPPDGGAHDGPGLRRGDARGDVARPEHRGPGHGHPRSRRQLRAAPGGRPGVRAGAGARHADLGGRHGRRGRGRGAQRPATGGGPQLPGLRPGRDGRDRQPGRQDALHVRDADAPRHPRVLRRGALRGPAQQQPGGDVRLVPGPAGGDALDARRHEGPAEVGAAG